MEKCQIPKCTKLAGYRVISCNLIGDVGWLTCRIHSSVMVRIATGSMLVVNLNVREKPISKPKKEPSKLSS